MTIARWAIPFLLVAVTGCATAPTPVEPTKAVAGPQKPAVEAPKKAAAKPAAPKKTETAKVDPKKAPPKLETKQSDTAKLPPKPVTPKPVTVAAAPATPAGLPPSVFTDASALAPVPGDQSIVITDSAAISTDSLVDNAPTSTVPTPTYTMASLTEPAIVDPLLSQPAPRILPQAAVPQSVAPQPVVSSGAMAFLTKLEQSGSAPDGPYGYIILDAESGQTLNEGNADTPLAPASIAKLLAAVAILDTKGPNSTFRTSLLADGAVSGGVLNGDLHLVGSGDPSLNRSDLSGLAQRLASAGVRQVSGKFYYHGDALPEVAMIDRGQPAGAIYNTGISGLNLDHNEHRGASPVKDPAKYTADGMRRAAESAGVSLPSPTKGRGQANGTEIASHDSAPVSVILTKMFDISRNMTAEVLGAVAASEIAGKPSTLREAASTNAQWAQSTIGSIGGLEWVGFNFPNNSGLTTSARATPRQMAALVRHGYLRHGEQFKRIYEEQSTGSSAGVDFAIRAKIGTMSYVRGLGGIISVGGRDMAFAIMAMDPARSTRNAKAWMGKARRLEQALMSDWLKNFWPSAQQVASR